MKNLYRYYCVFRPPMPGTVPRGMVNLVEFDAPKYVEKIDHEAWGYVEYEKPLTAYQVYEYELAEEDTYDA